jgi:Tol biopolymer transport system component/tRNA A-37 threonylcarbamoyl transferase component Bud32
MAIPTGTRIGPYEVTSQIGEGGMGVVYRARDTKLQRDVALKVLPDHFANDPDRLARFQREAQLLASLNHPNVAHIYGLEQTGGTGCIVMELVEGETIAERLRSGPLSVDEAVRIAGQIADAVEAAHERGIIHRDLKPANIKVTADGTVKVLDFGLAKIAEPLPATASRTIPVGESPTAMSASIPGVVMGTAAYMSPEQARGRTVDTRTDIWAVGCVLYEMLTARPAFGGETVTDIVARILEREPEWNVLPADVPSSIRTLLEVTLSKDLRQRLQHIGDTRVFLNRASFRETPSVAVPAARSTRRMWLARAAVSLALLAALIPATLYFLRVPEEESEFRFEMPAAAGIVNSSLTLSPDSRRLAYVANTGGTRAVWIQQVGSLDAAQPLPGTEDAGDSLLGWAPDSRRLGFFAGGLKTIDVNSGSVSQLASTPIAAPGAWSRDGDILFSTLGAGIPVIGRVGEIGGDVTLITTPDPAVPTNGHFLPRFLPDDRRFLFIAPPAALRQEETGLYAGSLDTQSTVRRGTLGVDADVRVTNQLIAIANGYLLRVHNRELFAERIDDSGAALGGDPVRIAERVAGFSVSDKLLIYRQAAPDVVDESVAVKQLVWFDRTGKPEVRPAAEGDYLSVELSPDERRVAVTAGRANQLDVSTIDLERGSKDLLTTQPLLDWLPLWDPVSGSEIIFSSQGGAPGTPDLYRRSSVSVGGNRHVFGDTSWASITQDWSPDGKYLLLMRRQAPAAAGWDLWYLPLTTGGKATPYIESQFQKVHAQFSPNGRWVAYATNESGNFQIVIQTFPDPKSKIVVTSKGGIEPRWSRDGRELYYLAPDGKLMVVPVVKDDGDLPVFGPETALFPTPLTTFSTAPGFRYDVADNGKRFLIIAPVNASPATASATEADSTPIVAIYNWAAALRKTR